MLHLLSLLAVALASPLASTAAAAASSSSPQCGTTIVAGDMAYSFDLSAAEGLVSNFTAADGSVYFLSVCSPLPSALAAGCRPNGTGSAAPTLVHRSMAGKCLEIDAEGAGGAWALITPQSPARGVQKSFFGSDCDIEGLKVPRETVVRYVCDPSAGRLGAASLVSAVSNPTECRSTFAVLSAAACPVASPAPGSCVFVDAVGNGTRYVYDLSPVSADGPLSTVHGALAYTFSPCVPLPASEPVLANCSTKENVTMVARYDNNEKCSVESTLGPDRGFHLIDDSSPGDGMVLTTANGEACDNEGIKLPRVVNVRFACDPSVSPSGPLRFVSSVSNITLCETTFEVAAASACPKKTM